MHEIDRRSMLKVVAALWFGPYCALADENQAPFTSSKQALTAQGSRTRPHVPTAIWTSKS